MRPIPISKPRNLLVNDFRRRRISKGWNYAPHKQAFYPTDSESWSWVCGREGRSSLNEFPRKRVESIKHDAGGRLIEISGKSRGRLPHLSPRSALRKALVTKKNRYEEVLNYRLIAGGFWRASGRRLHNGCIYLQRGPIKIKTSGGGRAFSRGAFTTARINNAAVWRNFSFYRSFAL